MKTLRRIKEALFLVAVFPLILVFCALNWDDELLGGRGE